MGRIDHVLLDGEQAGADLHRVEAAKKHLDLVYCEMAPGDVLFFRCSTLHKTDQNRSVDRRSTLNCCHNAARNGPFSGSSSPARYAAGEIAESEIKAAGLNFSDATEEGTFFKKPIALPELKKKADAKPVVESANAPD